MPKWSEGRIALVGDAAYCVSLMAGQGSALAMTGAYVLAGELARMSGCHAEAFANYESRLRAFIGAKQRGAEHFGGAFAPKTWWGLFLRNQVIRAAAIPGIARLTFGRDILDRLKLPAYRWRDVANRKTHQKNAVPSVNTELMASAGKFNSETAKIKHRMRATRSSERV